MVEGISLKNDWLKKRRGALNGMVPTISNDIQLYKTKIYDEYLSISNGHRKASKNGNYRSQGGLLGVLLDRFLHHSRVG